MTQQHPLLATLHEWEQITDFKVEESRKPLETDETALVLYKLTLKPKGKAPNLPSAALLPV